jgi:hypothetical protein
MKIIFSVGTASPSKMGYFAKVQATFLKLDIFKMSKKKKRSHFFFRVFLNIW